MQGSTKLYAKIRGNRLAIDSTTLAKTLLNWLLDDNQWTGTVQESSNMYMIYTLKPKIYCMYDTTYIQNRTHMMECLCRTLLESIFRTIAYAITFLNYKNSIADGGYTLLSTLVLKSVQIQINSYMAIDIFSMLDLRFWINEVWEPVPGEKRSTKSGYRRFRVANMVPK